MATVVRMPGVSADAAEATLVEWTVATGDAVKRGDVIATVETDKAVVDIEADADGELLRTFAVAGDSVAIGGPIAVLLGRGETAADEATILAGLGLSGDDPTDAGSDAASGLGPQASGPLAAEDEERSQDELVPGSSTGIGHTADAVVPAAVPAVAAVDASDSNGSRGRLFATPLVRRLAAEAGVSLEGIRGTGPGGRIRRRDLEVALASATTNEQVVAPTEPAAVSAAAPASPAAPAAAAQAAPAPVAAASPAEGAAYTDVPVTRFRRAVATALTASKQTVPHFYLKATCRVDRLLELRAQVNDAAGGGAVRVTVNDFVVKAAGLALQRVPEMNVAWTGDAVRQFEGSDVAVAMATERGLVVPVVRGVERRSLSDVSATVKDLAARAGANTLKQPELQGGSLTISNLGMFGVEEFSAIINPPQAGILAVGAITPQAVEGDDGQVVIARCLKVVLSADHRPVDGALAAQWLQQFKAIVENPLQILV